MTVNCFKNAKHNVCGFVTVEKYCHSEQFLQGFVSLLPSRNDFDERFSRCNSFV